MNNLKIFSQIISFLLCILLGISFSALEASLTINRAVANNSIEDNFVTKQGLKTNALEFKGKQAYRLADYHRARHFWQQALSIYQQNQDIVSQARVMSSLALVNYQLGYEKEAQIKIQKSRKLLESQATNTDIDRTLAQVLNNQGIIELALGNAELAIASWDLAIAAYQRVGDDLGVIRAQLNQARGFKSIGLYQRAINKLTVVSQALENQPDSQLKIVGLRSYGDILRLVGNIEQSQSVLQTSLAIASRLSLVREEVKSLLALGNTLVAEGDIQGESSYQVASEHYQRGMQLLCDSISNCAGTNLSLQINLAQLNLLLKTESGNQGVNLVNIIKQQLSALALNRELIDSKIGFVNSLVKLRQQEAQKANLSSEIPSWSEIITLVDSAIADAQKLNYLQAESYSWGLKGQLQEILLHWDNASHSTTRALEIAQTINAPEISYLWQWQLGRIERARGNQDLAIANYLQGVSLLNTLSQDIAHIERNIQYSFRDTVEPVYREAVALLLDVAPGKTVSQQNLIQARDTIESLQIAELHNFFREACLQRKTVTLNSVDRHAAAIYPIILRDRLAVIVSLPNQPLIHYSVSISQEELEATIQELRRTIVIRSRRNFYEPATKLYSWLIAPVVDQLAQYQIQTIVFVPDGALRNVPVAALYDGANYLIEQYNLVLNPGLQLLNPRPLEKTTFKTLAVGLTQPRENFAALEYVNRELAAIREQVKGSVLVDEEFTTQALQKKIKFSDYPIVHIATHGQFSSSLEDTFLLAWDERINLNQLNQILQTRTGTQQEAIELLILSACETATGDKWAALGLAGMAIQAGARSTIATLWSINDQATAELMEALYRELTTKSTGKAEAIRQAQLSLLHNPQYKHPFYWAAYTMIGNWL